MSVDCCQSQRMCLGDGRNTFKELRNGREAVSMLGLEGCSLIRMNVQGRLSMKNF